MLRSAVTDYVHAGGAGGVQVTTINQDTTEEGDEPLQTLGTFRCVCVEGGSSGGMGWI